jgi:hypothetical protein
VIVWVVCPLWVKIRELTTIDLFLTWNSALSDCSLVKGLSIVSPGKEIIFFYLAPCPVHLFLILGLGSGNDRKNEKIHWQAIKPANKKERRKSHV